MLATPLVSLLAAFSPAHAPAPPQCQPRTYTTRPGTPVQLDINCVGAGNDPTVAIVTAPIGGTLPTLPGTYTPAPGFNGVDQVRYTVTANGETSELTSINLVVNSLPTCSDGTATTTVNTPLKLSFPCTDPDRTTVLIRVKSGPQHGTVDPTVGTQITYTPEAGFVGTDELQFEGMDGAFVTAERKLTITVTAAATPTPTATATPDPTATPVATVAPTPVPTVQPPTDTTAPAITVKAGKASVAKGVMFTLRSDEAGTAKLTLAAGKHTATKTAKLVNGTTKVTVKLSAKARKALKGRKSVKATLTVVATDAAGNKATKKLKLALKR